MSGQPSKPLDLILRLSGGEQDGELISINTKKCFLGLAGKSGPGGRPQCAIFRGPQGATLRSWGNDTLVNGESKTVHWLATGDQIEFPDSMAFEVQQLGYIPADSAGPEVCPIPKSTDMKFEQESSTQLCEMNENEAEDKINQLASQISEIKEQNEFVHGRFQELDDRMSQLAAQISTLVSLASCGNTFEPAQENARISCATVVELPVDKLLQSRPQPTRDDAISSDWDRFESSNFSNLSEQVDVVSAVNEEDEPSCVELTDATDESIEAMDENETLPKNESVADLLARMKEEGQWSGIPGEDNVEPAPIQPVDEVAIPAPVAAGGEDADVEDYMSQLLSRMRGGEEPKPSLKAATPKQQPKQEKKPIAAPIDLLKPEEFVPKQRAEKLESLSAMRELANSTARTAVESSQKSVRQETAYVQLGIAVAALIMSGYYFGVQSKALFDTGFFVGIFCIGVTGFLGYRFFNNMVLLKSGSATSTSDKQPADKPTGETSPA